MTLLHNARTLQNTPYVTVWDWRTAFPKPCKLNSLLTAKEILQVILPTLQEELLASVHDRTVLGVCRDGLFPSI